MRNNLFIVGAVFLLVVLVVYFGLLHKGTPVAEEGDATFQEMVGEESSWDAYTNATLGFSIQHPSVLEINELDNNTVTLSYVGPTQTQQTEFFDGISINFIGGELEGEMTLEALATSQLTQAQEIGGAVSELSTVTLGGKEALTYSYVTSGEFQVWFFESDAGSFFAVSSFVADPAEMGFAEVRNRVLAQLVIQ